MQTAKTDQTGWMPRLIWIFAGCSHFVGFVVRRLIIIDEFHEKIPEPCLCKINRLCIDDCASYFIFPSHLDLWAHTITSLWPLSLKKRNQWGKSWQDVFGCIDGIVPQWNFVYDFLEYLFALLCSCHWNTMNKKCYFNVTLFISFLINCETYSHKMWWTAFHSVTTANRIIKQMVWYDEIFMNLLCL